jgi:hypothetical protein
MIYNQEYGIDIYVTVNSYLIVFYRPSVLVP